MELQLMMDGGAETLHGAMWFSNTAPSYEQLSPVRTNRCDIVTASQQVRKIIKLSLSFSLFLVRFILISYKCSLIDVLGHALDIVF